MEYLLKTPQGLENSSLSYTTNSLNQYDKDEYDLSGNQTLLHPGGYTWQVQYNAENRPVRFLRERNTAEEPEVSLVMKYDSRGRRTVKTAFVDGVMADSRKFVYDDFLLVAELRSQNPDESGYALHQTFLWDSAETVATRPLCMTCWQNGSHGAVVNTPLDYTLECFNKKHSDNPFWLDVSSSGRYFYIQDHNKNIKGIVNDMGALVGEYDYSPFGEMVISTVDDIVSSDSFRFSSEYYDRELGMYYYNYRHYNPQDGRWVSRDPIKENGGINLFSFINNSPVLQFDILGFGGYGETDRNDKCIAERKEKMERINQLISQSNPKEPNCSASLKCNSVTLVIEVSDPCRNSVMSYGHAGIGLEGMFYDSGPNGIGQLYPYWSKEWPTMRKMELDVGTKANAPVLEVKFCVCEKEFIKITQKWILKDSRWGVFNVWGIGGTCSSDVARCIGGSYNPLISPDDILNDIAPTLKNACGSERGKSAYIKIIENPWPKSDYS